MTVGPGTFIIFEGTDGSGKSTTARAVHRALASGGADVLYLDKSAPEIEGDYARRHLTVIREILWEYEPSAPLGVLGDPHWLHLIASWFHALHACAVEPAVRGGRVVVADGWYFKYLARFMTKRGDIVDHAQECFSRVPAPDAVVLLDVDPVVAHRRKQAVRPSESGDLSGDAVNRVAGFVDYQNEVRRMMFKLRRPNWTVIDTTTQPPEAVIKAAYATTLELIQAKRAADAPGLVLRPAGD